jgi:LytS/YehU family sensor histidine kinase
MRLPLFWQFQIAGWLTHFILTLPLKYVATGSWRMALLVSLVVEPMGFVLTTALRAVYLRWNVRVEEPVRLVSWVAAGCTTAAAIDWTVATAVQPHITQETVLNITLFGMSWIRALQYFMWTTLYFWIKSAMAARERALNLIQAEAAARDAELRMLRAQMNPHFLFNSLNTVLAGLDRDPKSLTAVVQGLADYLRYSLAHRHTALVPLGDEFDAAANYLVVEKARFRDDLVFTTHIDDAARTTSVPGVMLQPLIENAVKHGFKTTAIPLRLRVDVRAGTDGRTTIEVANSGRWIEPPVTRSVGDASGVGLESLQRRLALLYPETHKFDVVSSPEEVAIRIELRG